MIESKLTFRVQEIEDGKSQRSVSLGDEDLDFSDLEEIVFRNGEVEIDFEKRLHFIDVKFRVQARLGVTCGRSLKRFSQQVEGTYEVVFKPSVEEASEGEESTVKAIDSRNLTISIEREVRDTILLGLPAKIVHPDYLDSEGELTDFETRRFGSSDESDTVDPRWEALRKLKRES